MSREARAFPGILGGRRGGGARAVPVVAATLLSALLLQAQVSVQSVPAALLIESTGTATLNGRVSGTFPGETTAVTWSLNDQFFSTSTMITFRLPNAPSVVPLILKATSVLDPSKFASVPVVPLQKSTLGEVGFPEAVAYHPGTGKIYVAALVGRGSAVDTNLLEISPGGSQTAVLTFPSEIIDKLLPYSSGGTPFLLAVGLVSGSVHAVNLNTRTSRRIVSGLQTPVSGAFHPVSGDLYIAEQNARRLSVVTRAALDSAVSGNSTASFQPLPVMIPSVSGVGFLADRGTQKVALLAPTTGGVLYKVNLDDNSFDQVAASLGTAQELLVVESPTLGFSFVLTGSSTRTDGGGQVASLVPPDGGQSFGSPYGLATGLDTVTDLAFVPAGSPYSSEGRPLLVASSSSQNASRGKVVGWTVDPLVPAPFFVYNDQTRPSLTLVSPVPETVLAPGAPLEIRWRMAETNSANPANAHVSGPAEILVSTDGGNSFSGTEPSYIPSGPYDDEYLLRWQVPARLAGSSIRLRLQVRKLGGGVLTATSSGLFHVLPVTDETPSGLLLSPNYAVAGETATVTVEGLNFRAGIGVNLGDGVAVNSVTPQSSSQFTAEARVDPLADPGSRAVALCAGESSCSLIENAFFVLAPGDPRIRSLQPPLGAPGATVIIAGDNFWTRDNSFRPA